MSADMWKSTFWQNEFARPDKLTSYLEKVFTKDKGKIHQINVNDLEVSGSLAMASSLNLFQLIGASGSGSGSTNIKKHVSEDNLRTWLKENKHEVQWTGEKFKVKPMDLYRLNKQKMSDQQNIVSTRVQVHQVQYTYSMPLSNLQTGNDTSLLSGGLTRRIDAIEVSIRKELEAAMKKEREERMDVEEQLRNYLNDSQKTSKLGMFAPIPNNGRWYLLGLKGFL